MKYKIDLDEQEYIDILTILAIAYSNNQHDNAKHLLEVFVNKRLRINNGA